VRHGLLNQKPLSVPRDRIPASRCSAHVIYRVLGLSKVQVGTGSRSPIPDGQRDLRLDALAIQRCEACAPPCCRAPVPARHGGPPAACPPPAPPGPAVARAEIAGAPSWLRFAKFNSPGWVIFQAAAG